MVVSDATEAVRAGLERLTGFPHAVFVQSGTAAIELALSVLTDDHATVAIPALACWSVSYAVTKIGRRPVFRDIDAHWSAHPRGEPAAATILVDPWGGSAAWS